MANPNITDEMREHLTDEELEGMEDTDLVDEGENEEEGEGNEAEQGRDDGKDPDQSKQKTDEELQAEKAEADEAANKAKADESNAESEKAAAQQPVERKPRPVFESPDVPDDVDDQISAAKLAKIKLAEKFDEGELTAVEYAKQVEELNDFQRDLENKRFKAQLAAESQQTRELESWEDTCQAFLSKHPEISQSRLRYDSFDYAVRLVTGDPDNANLTGTQMLEKAHQNWVSELGIQVKAPAQQQKQEPENKPAKQQPVVPNIGSLPAAQASDTDDGKFAYLDRLAESDPLKFEAQLAKLSDADREAYLSM